jgi:hypothetical protein
VAAEHEGGHVLDGDLELVGKEVPEARRIEHARHADDAVVRQAGEFPQCPDHRVERVGDADYEAVGRMRLDALADRLHHLQVDADEVVAAHAGLAGDAGGDDADVGAGDVGIIVGAGQLDIIALDRAGLGEIERLALRDSFRHVDHDDVAHFADGGEVGQGSADHAGADQRDFLTSHGAAPAFLFCQSGTGGRTPPNVAPA